MRYDTFIMKVARGLAGDHVAWPDGFIKKFCESPPDSDLLEDFELESDLFCELLMTVSEQWGRVRWHPLLAAGETSIGRIFEAVCEQLDSEPNYEPDAEMAEA